MGFDFIQGGRSRHADTRISTLYVKKQASNGYTQQCVVINQSCMEKLGVVTPRLVNLYPAQQIISQLLRSFYKTQGITLLCSLFSSMTLSFMNSWCCFKIRNLLKLWELESIYLSHQLYKHGLLDFDCCLVSLLAWETHILEHRISFFQKEFILKNKL